MMIHTTAIKIAAPILLATCCATASYAQPGANGMPKFLVHGNYCGPGNNAPLAPSDALDAACARHDACTPSKGLPTRACNLRLQREAEAIALNPRQPQETRTAAGVVAAFAAATPSKGYPDVVPERALATATYIVSTARR
jgi:hypothetical protein